MQNIIITMASLAATVAAVGTGTVINNCDYEVEYNMVPSYDGVHTGYSGKLAANGGSTSQEWTVLDNGAGWSMKLNPVSDTSSLMQFEYTVYTDPAALWFDLSAVNGGDPFKGDWLLSSSDDTTCTVKQTFYAYATDDSVGMQPECSPDVSITYTLCPTDGDEVGSAVSSLISSVLEPVSTPTTTAESSTSTTEAWTSATPTTSSTATPTSSTEASTSVEATSSVSVLDAAVFNVPTSTTAASVPSSTSLATSTTKSASSTTFATQTTSLSTDDSGDVVTVIDTVVATEIVTVWGQHHHWQRHAHHHAHN